MEKSEQTFKKASVVIVGATGAVGREMINCLDALNFPIQRLRLVASERSAGKKLNTPFGEIEIETISKKVFEESDIALFSAGGDISKEWREQVVNSDCIMIDNSSAFRYEEDVPLVVPEINSDAISSHKGVISNPNCTTIIATVVLYPLYKIFGLKKVIVSTYQATSGAGASGMQELITQTKSLLEDDVEIDSLIDSEKINEVIEEKQVQPKAFAHPISFNVIPHIDAFQDNDYTKEEMKVVWETKKIFGDEDLSISCTAVRIPTLRAHSESIVIETEKDITPEQAREVFNQSLGIKVVDNLSKNLYPMPINVSQKFDVEVGRIRRNLVFGEKGLEFFVCGDQLLKGAALNAVQIANLLI